MAYIGNQISGEHNVLFREFFISVGLTTFTLQEIPRSKDNLIVTINGIQLSSSEFSLNNNLLTFNQTPAIGDEINVVHLTSRRSLNFQEYNTSTEDALVYSLTLG